MEKQMCRTCKSEKSLSEFHRRGADWQRVCKECRKAHVPSGEKQKVVFNTPAERELVANRITELESGLRSKAKAYAVGTLDADDIFSEIVIELLCKSKPDDSPARLLTRATWVAKKHIRNANGYSAVVLDERAMTGRKDEEESDGEIILCATPSAEDVFCMADASIELVGFIHELSESQQTIVVMLSQGYSQREIAKSVNLSDQAISSSVQRIAVELTSRGLSLT